MGPLTLRRRGHPPPGRAGLKNEDRKDIGSMARKLKQARWSAEDRRLLELAAASKSVEEVAHLMRRSPAAIYKVAIRLKRDDFRLGIA